MNDTEYILSQLQLYYDCRLTDAEETRLRILVARSGSHHPEIERARALMGFRRPRRNNKRRVFTIATVAASLLLIAAIGSWWSITPRSTAGTSYAYSGGRYINNESEVLDLLSHNLNEFGGDIDAANQSMASDLDEFATFITDNLNE